MLRNYARRTEAQAKRFADFSKRMTRGQNEDNEINR